jgi:hypothetical protein
MAERINATTNGLFVPSVTFETHYLVCEKHDSQKALKAAKLGTAIISEAELEGYLASGIFPSTKLPIAPKHVNNFPDILWVEHAPRLYLLTYCDRDGNNSVRMIAATGEGHTANNKEARWIGGYDGPTFKTWRKDRIISMQSVENE